MRSRALAGEAVALLHEELARRRRRAPSRTDGRRLRGRAWRRRRPCAGAPRRKPELSGPPSCQRSVLLRESRATGWRPTAPWPWAHVAERLLERRGRGAEDARIRANSSSTISQAALPTAAEPTARATSDMAPSRDLRPKPQEQDRRPAHDRMDQRPGHRARQGERHRQPRLGDRLDRLTARPRAPSAARPSRARACRGKSRAASGWRSPREKLAATNCPSLSVCPRSRSIVLGEVLPQQRASGVGVGPVIGEGEIVAGGPWPRASGSRRSGPNRRHRPSRREGRAPARPGATGGRRPPRSYRPPVPSSAAPAGRAATSRPTSPQTNTAAATAEPECSHPAITKSPVSPDFPPALASNALRRSPNHEPRASRNRAARAGKRPDLIIRPPLPCAAHRRVEAPSPARQFI